MSSLMESSSSEKGLLLACVGFLATRLLVLFLLPPLLSDVPLYAGYAARTIHGGEVPYADFNIEYPPVSFWATLPPCWLASEAPGTAGFLKEYRFFFRVEMFLCDAVAFALFLHAVWWRRRAFLTPAAWAYVLAGFLLGPVLYDRLDMVLLLPLMLAAWGWAAAGSAARPLGPFLACAAGLGIGVAAKLIPVVAAPFLGLALLRRLAPGQICAVAGAFLLAAAGPFIVQTMVSGKGVWWFLGFHAERGLEVESLYGSAFMALSPWLTVRAFQGPGSWDISAPGAQTVASCSLWLTLGLLAALGLTSVVRARRSSADSGAFTPALLALIDAPTREPAGAA